MRTMQELEAAGITNSDKVVELFKKYKAESQSYSSNSGDIKSISDITNNIRESLRQKRNEKNRESIAAFVMDSLSGK